MYTHESAYACTQERDAGSVSGGKRADLALLDRDLTAIDLVEIRDARVQMTVAGGQVAWEE